MISIKKKIILCTKCGGTGRENVYVEGGTHRDTECSLCEGSGMLLETTTTEPYNNQKVR